MLLLTSQVVWCDALQTYLVAFFLVTLLLAELSEVWSPTSFFFQTWCHKFVIVVACYVTRISSCKFAIKNWAIKNEQRWTPKQYLWQSNTFHMRCEFHHPVSPYFLGHLSVLPKQENVSCQKSSQIFLSQMSTTFKKDIFTSEYLWEIVQIDVRILETCPSTSKLKIKIV